MNSENLVASTFNQAKDDPSLYEKVALILYAAGKEEEIAKLTLSEIKKLARENRTGVKDKSVSGLLSHLRKKGWVDKSGSTYYLTLDGEREVKSSLITLEPNRASRNADFLRLSDSNDSFYGPLISDVNICYRVGVNDAVLILVRKIIENLLIDILRGHYGSQNINMFYIPSQGRFHSLSTLLKNLEDNKLDFRIYHSEIDDLTDEIDEFRERGNSSAHSIEVSIPDDRLNKLSSRASRLVETLLRIKRQVEAGANNSAN